MISEVMPWAAMNSDLETGWFQGTIDAVPHVRRQSRAVSIQLIWKDITGALDGEIEILASNRPGEGAVGMTIRTLVPDNTNDSELIMLAASFSFLNIKYTCNGNTGGRLGILVDYE